MKHNVYVYNEYEIIQLHSARNLQLIANGLHTYVSTVRSWEDGSRLWLAIVLAQPLWTTDI
jgi:hypothetical protein